MVFFSGHNPSVRRSAEFAEGTDCMPHYEKLPSGGKDVIATLCVKLSQKEARAFFRKLLASWVCLFLS